MFQASDYYLLESVPNSSSPNRSLEKDFAKNLRKQCLGSPAIGYILLFKEFPRNYCSLYVECSFCACSAVLFGDSHHKEAQIGHFLNNFLLGLMFLVDFPDFLQWNFLFTSLVETLSDEFLFLSKAEVNNTQPPQHLPCLQDENKLRVLVKQLEKLIFQWRF